MKILVPLVSAVFLVAGTQFILTLQPEAVITVEAVSPQEIHDLGWTTHPSNGLRVVGVGELVYVSGADADGEAVTSYAWSLVGPMGSTATLDSVGTEWNTFRADMEGEFTVMLTITTATGSSDASLGLTAANYVGVGTMVPNVAPDAGAGQCGACHPGNTAAWALTGHGSKFTRAIDGVDHSFYAERCVECHTVGYNTDPEADNFGFDDVQALLGWTFPDTLQAGNWDDLVTNYAALAQKANIQCENCHGAGSQHKGALGRRTDPTAGPKIQVSLDEGMCGRCHEEEPYHLRNIQWKNSAHATGGTFASRGNSASCAPCHSGYGFVNRTDIEYAARDLPEVGPQNISCAVCHDPHSNANEHHLRTLVDIELENGVVISTGGTGKLCMNCHHDRREGGAEVYVSTPRSTFRGPHGNVQADMLFGTNYISFGRVLPNSTHKDVLADACVSCHMYETPAVSELGHNKLGEHSWSMHAEEIVGLDTLEVDFVAPCRNCHNPAMTSYDEFLARQDHDGDGEIEGVQHEVEGLMEQVAMLLPPVGEPTVDIRDPLWNTEESLLQRKAAWNYLYVEEDQSHGMHNFQLTVALLKLTKEVLTYGVLSEGVITGIEDVPNDQGRQLAVGWNRFGGDGASDTPLQDYYVWRRVDDAMAKTSGTVFQSLADVPTGEKAEAVSGSMSVVMDGALWTAVGHQPAAAMELYAAVVPTLADSTADGVYWSVFKVSGHAEDSQIYVVSAADSAYSIDNLVPTTPMMSLAGVNPDVNNPSVSWLFEFDMDEPLNADFKYFAVYRGIRKFDPTVREPIATTTELLFTDTDVQLGQTYYYTVAALDFSGNRSDFAELVVASVVVGVEGTGEIPAEFALHQNYPNPFNPTTVITYDVPRQSDVRMVVYDLLGRQVRVLVNGSVSAGKHRVTLDADRMSSGLYVVRYDTPDGVFERTIMLVK